MLSKECYSLNDMDKDELTFNMNLRGKWTNAGYKADEISLIVSDFFVFLALMPNKVYYESEFKAAVKNNIEEVKKLIEEGLLDLTDNDYIIKEESNFYSKETGEVYDVNKTIRETDLKNGSRIILI